MAYRGRPGISVNNGVALGEGDQGGVDTESLEVVADELGGAEGIGVVIGLGADAGNAKQGLELLFEVGSVFVQIGVDPLDRHGRGSPDEGWGKIWNPRVRAE